MKPKISSDRFSSRISEGRASRRQNLSAEYIQVLKNLKNPCGPFHGGFSWKKDDLISGTSPRELV
jgi:hypothetical protein